MIEHTRISSKFSEKFKKRIDGTYLIKENKVYLNFPAKLDVPSRYKHFDSIESGMKIPCQFLNTRLYSVGKDFHEFLVEDAYLGESRTSFESNKYSSCLFNLSDDIFSFFDEPWQIDREMDSLTEKKETFRFKEKKDRITNIILNDNTTLKIEVGYQPSYTKTSYQLHSSVRFELVFLNPVTREEIFSLTEAVLEFYSLFCRKRLSVTAIILVTFDAGIAVRYYGNKVTLFDKNGPYGNLIIEYREIKQPVEDALITWVKNYEQNKIALELVKDAQSLKDQQLQFICLARCIEVFHSVNFKRPKSTSTLTFLEELRDFANKEKLSDKEEDFFNIKEPKIDLSHRVYDLIRYAYSIIGNKKLWLIFSEIKSLNKAHKIVATRNYYIHFSDSAKKNAWPAKELEVVNSELQVFIKVLFLKQLGINDPAISFVCKKMEGYLFGR